MLTGYQASRRGGAVRVKVCGDRVKIRGQAVTSIVGRIHAPIAIPEAAGQAAADKVVAFLGGDC